MSGNLQAFQPFEELKTQLKNSFTSSYFYTVVKKTFWNNSDEGLQSEMSVFKILFLYGVKFNYF